MFFFFFNDTATTEIYTLSLHDALPISVIGTAIDDGLVRPDPHVGGEIFAEQPAAVPRSEEHTSELQSLTNLVCRLLLEKKKKKQRTARHGKARGPTRRNSYHTTAGMWE